MYKGEGLRYIEDGDKYDVLMDLYNDWHERTYIMSVGNTNVEEWFRLLEYCKSNKKETAHFYLDLIDCYEKEHKEGYRADDFVGFFNNIIEEVFNDDKNFPLFNGFVPGNVAQNLYKTYVEWFLEGKPQKIFGNWLSRFF